MAFRMLATAAARTALRAPSTSYRFASIATRSSPINTSLASRPSTWAFSPRFYSAAAGLSKQDIEARILDVLKSFEKVDAAKLTPTSKFAEDLGLDSLDAVEVVMAIEEEFAIEIPDAEADEIKTVQEAIEYIAKTPEAH